MYPTAMCMCLEYIVPLIDIVSTLDKNDLWYAAFGLYLALPFLEH